MAISNLTRSELLALLEAARERRERDWLMILVAFTHGLRASELVSLTADSIKDGHITVRRLKGSLRTIQPLMEFSEPLLSERKPLVDLAGNQRGNQRLFPITRQHFWRLMQRYGRAAKIPAHKRHPHALKHSIAMSTIGLAGIEHTRQWLGHKSLSSTGAYLKVTDEQAGKAVRQALGNQT